MNSPALLTLLALAVSPSAFAVNPLDGLPDNVAKLHVAATDGDCDSDLPSGSEAFDLGFGKKLYIVPCIMGAYQGSGRVYLTEGEGKVVNQVIVLGYNASTKGVEGALDMTEPAYDPKTRTLSTFGKGRGLGDCGGSSLSKVTVDEYTWSVKTTEVRFKAKCDGKYNDWPVVFKQK